MKLLLSLALVATGCATTETPTPSAAPGVKRWTAGATRSHSVKARSRRRYHPSAASRDLARPSIANPLVVTAYCATGSRNAAGLWPTVGTAAANGYPLGARLSVPGVGVVTVEDRSAPSATQVDIFMGSGPSCEARAVAFGRRYLEVRRVA